MAEFQQTEYQKGLNRTQAKVVATVNLVGFSIILLSVLFSTVLAEPFALASEAFGPLCLLKRMTSFPCPTCGMTRAFLLISNGQMIEALHYSLLSFPLYFGIVGFFAASLAMPVAAYRFLTFFATPQGLYFIIGLLAAAWGYKLLMPAIYW